MLRVAIIDDEEDTRNAMIGFIEWETFGITVIGVAADGYAAYDLINTQKPDIVLMDIQIPGMTGIEVIERIRQEGIISPAFVIISGYDEFEYARQAIRLSVVDYLLKPFRPQDVIMVIQKSIKHLEHIRVAEEMQARSGDTFIERLAVGESAINLSLLQYPSKEELRLLESLKVSTLEVVLAELEVFWDRLCTMNVSIKCRANCAIILYVEVCRFLMERGCRLSTPHFSDWTDSSHDASCELFSILKAIMTEAFSLIKDKGCFHVYVNSAIQYIQEHFRENLTLERVAQHVVLSPPYLSSLFTRALGTTFTNYIQSVRIQKAKQLLLTSALKVYEIADLVGYDDAKYFSQVFRKIEGISPSQFRSQSQLVFEEEQAQ